MSDVQAMISAWQQGLPGSAWHADTVTPDTASLGEWMAGRLATSGGLKITRSADAALLGQVADYLRREGVDVGRALERAEDAQAAETSRTRADVHAVRGLAIALKKAERRLGFEQAGLRDGCAGFTLAKVRAAAEEVTAAEGALEEACSHDRGLARQARRAVA